jgi:hypothetical protein
LVVEATDASGDSAKTLNQHAVVISAAMHDSHKHLVMAVVGALSAALAGELVVPRALPLALRWRSATVCETAYQLGQIPVNRITCLYA